MGVFFLPPPSSLAVGSPSSACLFLLLTLLGDFALLPSELGVVAIGGTVFVEGGVLASPFFLAEPFDFETGVTAAAAEVVLPPVAVFLEGV